MNATEQFLNFIQFKGGQITLGEILNTHYAAEYRRMFTEIRRKGWQVTVELNRKRPSENKYLLIPPVKFESNGQAVMF